ncbi:YTH domain-containing protein ECT3-like [Daucus carota subsp. sativus]|uniref:YTH domain-containing protein ECT3-like n=1 Tax=Daucus carota subsp. sativus TaxID=79200 RepID=UPI003083B6D3
MGNTHHILQITNTVALLGMLVRMILNPSMWNGSDGFNEKENEDDIHKCIKYNVWSRTPNGNRKLNAAFHDTQAKTSDSGMECPIFLFYSLRVNGSGQYVGLAEMIGQMDFAKIMNFWQRDKWNGFFPVKWHIVKDIPNTQLRHIVIESNDNKPVTHSVGTQEIGLQQGLKMLKIFKSYSGVTSMLDDFNFHENHEQSLKAKRNQMRAPQTEIRSIMNTQ